MSEITNLFDPSLTEAQLTELETRYKSLVVDMSKDEDFKKARITRTERNKLKEAVDRRRKDIASELKTVGDAMLKRIDEVYAPVVDKFEEEEKRRREVAAEQVRKKQEKIKQCRDQIQSIEGFIDACRGMTAKEIGESIEAVQNIDVETFHNEVISEAIATKKSVITRLTEQMQYKANSERIEAENEELKRKLAELESAQGEQVTDESEDDSIIESDEARTFTVQGNWSGSELNADEIADSIFDHLNSMEFVEVLTIKIGDNKDD